MRWARDEVVRESRRSWKRTMSFFSGPMGYINSFFGTIYTATIVAPIGFVDDVLSRLSLPPCAEIWVSFTSSFQGCPRGIRDMGNLCWNVRGPPPDPEAPGRTAAVSMTSTSSCTCTYLQLHHGHVFRKKEHSVQSILWSTSLSRRPCWKPAPMYPRYTIWWHESRRCVEMQWDWNEWYPFIMYLVFKSRSQSGFNCRRALGTYVTFFQRFGHRWYTQRPARSVSLYV